MNLKTIARNVGYALLVSALFMLLSIFVSVANGNDSALAALSISFLITFSVGAFPFIFVRKTNPITLREGYVIICLSWLLSFVFGMLPYALWGGPFTVINAWFESVSGFTTTGSTILDDIEALPHSLLFWRSSTHFIGGLGVVVFLLLIIPNTSPIRLRLANMELSSLTRDGYKSRANKAVYVFTYVYLAIAVLAFVSYLLAGMSVFDAICHALSVCATGGFSTRALSIGAFDSRLIEGLTMLFMFLSSIHFGMIYMAVVTRSLKPFRNPILKTYVISLAVFTLCLAAVLKFDGFDQSWGRTIWDSAFTTLSIASTSGFATIDNAGWPMQASILTMCMGVMCGCAGSTTGGLKVDRVIALFKAIRRQVSLFLHPSAVRDVKIGKRSLRDDEVSSQILYIALFSLMLVVSVFLCLLIGVSAHNAFAATVSSLSNVGPAIEELGLMGSFNSVPSTAKFLYTMDMFFGRVEIYPLLAIFAMVFERRKK